MTRAQHSSASHDWGTPRSVLSLERRVLGRFDVDPFSSPKWNAIVRAWRFVDAARDGTLTPWAIGAPTPMRAWKCTETAPRGEPDRDYTAHVNPPSNKTGELVACAWGALAGYHRLGWITAACYIGFSVEQLARLQRVDAVTSPLDHYTLVPEERIPYDVAPGVAGEDPTHASFLTLVGGTDAQIQLFHELGEQLGVITRRTRRRFSCPS